jgi:lipid-A-disaccharide synthase
MVNLIAGRSVVPELMQGRMTGVNLAAEARRLLADQTARAEMREGLAQVRRRLSTGERAPHRAGAIIQEIWEGQVAHVS